MMPPLKGSRGAARAASTATQAQPASRAVLDLSGRPEGMADAGKNARISWAARTDVGSLREHNEDSYLAKPPLFAVCDGMGGHAAGEVASSIAVHALAKYAPSVADAQALGEAVEAANQAVIEAPANGEGRQGMGCTCSACLIDGTHMAVAHVGDSRIYLLHAGTLVRVTHDHSLVEELVDAGEITADQARTHPHRSWVTRALGSDPDMYADRFTLDVQTGDRVILCSDGLSSMVEDAEIEDIAVSTPSPEVCVDALVSAALIAGGHDNVTCVVVDVLSDGTEEAALSSARRAMKVWVLGACAVLVIFLALGSILLSRCWYLSTTDGYVTVYQGVEGDFLGIPLSRLDLKTDLETTELPQAIQNQLSDGIPMGSEDEALTCVESYRQQLADEKASAQSTAEQVITSPSPDPTPEAQTPSSTTIESLEKTNGSNSENDTEPLKGGA